MKKLIAITCIAVLGAVFAGAAPGQVEPPLEPPAPDAGPVTAGELTLENNIDKASYAIGVDIAQNFKRADVQLNLDALVQGFKDIASGTEPAMADAERAQVMMEFQQMMMGKMQQVQQRESEESKIEGAAYLAEKAQQEGVKKTESGLLYEIIEEGTGATPKADDTVQVHYTGTLLDGKEFDSSHKRGRPAEFQVGQVIKGWQEALKMMKEGAHWKLYIPGDLAYGPQGNPRGGIPGNAVLLFDVELLEVVEKPANEVTIPQNVPGAQ